MRALIASILRHWPALAFVTSVAMLAIAHAFETFGQLTVEFQFESVGFDLLKIAEDH